MIVRAEGPFVQAVSYDKVMARGSSRGKWVAGILALVLGGSALACGAVIFGSFLLRSRTMDMKHAWAAFNGDTVSHWFNIPAESEILVAERYSDPIMGGGFLVEFQLPGSRTPEQWLKVVASGEGEELAKYKKGRYRYDASHTVTDVYWLEYRPADRTYVARYHWD